MAAAAGGVPFCVRLFETVVLVGFASAAAAYGAIWGSGLYMKTSGSRPQAEHRFFPTSTVRLEAPTINFLLANSLYSRALEQLNRAESLALNKLLVFHHCAPLVQVPPLITVCVSSLLARTRDRPPPWFCHVSGGATVAAARRLGTGFTEQSTATASSTRCSSTSRPSSGRCRSSSRPGVRRRRAAGVARWA